MVVIDGNNYDTFVTVAEADVLLRPTEFNTLWGAMDDDDKAGRLVRATRYVQSVRKWANFEIDDAEPRVKLGVSRIAAWIRADPEPQTAGDSVSSVKVGPIEVGFRPGNDGVTVDPMACRLLDMAAGTPTLTTVNRYDGTVSLNRQRW